MEAVPPATLIMRKRQTVNQFTQGYETTSKHSFSKEKEGNAELNFLGERMKPENCQQYVGRMYVKVTHGQ